MNIVDDEQKFRELLNKYNFEEPVRSQGTETVHFRWNNNSGKLSVTLEGDGHFGYAFYLHSIEQFKAGHQDGCLSEESLPGDMVDYLIEAGFVVSK